MSALSQYEILLKSSLGFCVDFPHSKDFDKTSVTKRYKDWLNVYELDGRDYIECELMDFSRFVIGFADFVTWARTNIVCDNLTCLRVFVGGNYGEKKVMNMNATKLLLMFDEQVVFNVFPKREGCKGALRISRMLPSSLDGFASDIYEQYAHYYAASDIAYGISFGACGGNAVSFNYLGGEDVFSHYDKLTNVINYYIMCLGESLMSNSYTLDDIAVLKVRSSYYMSIRNAFMSYDNFCQCYDKVTLLVDLKPFKEFESIYWAIIKSRLYSVVALCVGNKEVRINYDSDEGSLQVDGFDCDKYIIVEDVAFVDSKVNGLFRHCTFYNSLATI